MARKSLIPLVFLVLCLTSRARAGEFGEWGSPVNLGPAVNSAFNDDGPALSKDGLSLYFQSNRPGFGQADIWVSQRASKDSPWGPPVNLGPTINSPFGEAAPNLSRDGHELYFASNRPGGKGDFDIYVSRREHTHDDLAWGAPVLIGELNTSVLDGGHAYFENEAGRPQLYITSNRSGGAGGSDIWMSEQQEDGTWGAPLNVAELNSAAEDTRAAIRHDGLEIFFHSNRGGNLDLYVSRRKSVDEPWSSPENLGTVVNSPAGDLRPGISADGTELILGSNRPGSISGSVDLYMTTRSKRGQHE